MLAEQNKCYSDTAGLAMKEELGWRKMNEILRFCESKSHSQDFGWSGKRMTGPGRTKRARQIIPLLVGLGISAGMGQEWEEVASWAAYYHQLSKEFTDDMEQVATCLTGSGRFSGRRGPSKQESTGLTHC